MERRPDGVLGCGTVAGAEGRADRLALELLAPAGEVARRLGFSGRPANFVMGQRRIHDVLAAFFGLPHGVAAAYAAWLARSWWDGPSVREWLGL
jgi:hypothetical protein